MTDRDLMRQALEALNRSDYLGWQLNIPIIKALRERLAQPEMQPCAGRNCGSTNPNLHSAECFEDYEKATGMRAWQGLTDEEKAELDAEHGDDMLAHLDAIEAKLREKNA
jgi:hypothetical protein